MLARSAMSSTSTKVVYLVELTFEARRVSGRQGQGLGVGAWHVSGGCDSYKEVFAT